METMTVKPKKADPVKPWRVEIRAVNGVAAGAEYVDQEWSTFDEAVAAAKKAMTDLNAMCMEDNVSRRDYYKIAIIEL